MDTICDDKGEEDGMTGVTIPENKLEIESDDISSPFIVETTCTSTPHSLHLSNTSSHVFCDNTDWGHLDVTSLYSESKVNSTTTSLYPSYIQIPTPYHNGLVQGVRIEGIQHDTQLPLISWGCEGQIIGRLGDRRGFRSILILTHELKAHPYCRKGSWCYSDIYHFAKSNDFDRYREGVFIVFIQNAWFNLFKSYIFGLKTKLQPRFSILVQNAHNAACNLDDWTHRVGNILTGFSDSYHFSYHEWNHCDFSGVSRSNFYVCCMSTLEGKPTFLSTSTKGMTYRRNLGSILQCTLPGKRWDLISTFYRGGAPYRSSSLLEAEDLFRLGSEELFVLTPFVKDKDPSLRLRTLSQQECFAVLDLFELDFAREGWGNNEEEIQHFLHWRRYLPPEKIVNHIFTCLEDELARNVYDEDGGSDWEMNVTECTDSKALTMTTDTHKDPSTNTTGGVSMFSTLGRTKGGSSVDVSKLFKLEQHLLSKDNDGHSNSDDTNYISDGCDVTYMSTSREDGKPRLKAAIRDDAIVDYKAWDKVFKTQAELKSANVLRDLLLRRYWRSLRQEVITFLNQLGFKTSDDRRDVHACREALRRACNASWWEWVDGSSLFYWRWPVEFRKRIRDGTPFCRMSTILPWKGQNYTIDTAEEQAAVEKKEDKFINRRYIELADKPPMIHIPRFTVPKDTDIRVVWDCTRTGVNDKLFCPKFFLPTAQNLFDVIHPQSYSADFDIGEQFHNFPLHIKDRPLFGVKITRKMDNETITKLYQWAVILMGAKPSPYLAVQAMYWALEIVLGDPTDKTNPFHYERIVLNLPGSEDYNPSQPYLMKVRFDGKFACEILIYVDDGRVVGSNYQLCWEATRRAASILNSLGIQDAARKRRFPSLTLGLWSGNLIDTTNFPLKGVSQERWEQLRDYLKQLRTWEDEGDGIPRKEFHTIVGKFCHASQKYDYIKPYLKGMYLALHAWDGKENKDENGWGLKNKSKDPSDEVLCDMDDNDDGHFDDMGSCVLDEVQSLGIDFSNRSYADYYRYDSAVNKKAPPRVGFTPLLKKDLKALDKFFESEDTIMRPVRPDKKIGVVYGFGDASGAGFGSSFAKDGKIFYQHGVWANYLSEASSNYRELRNLIESLRLDCESGKLKDCQIFLFTDNWVAEACYHKGMSSSEALYTLILELQLLEMKYNLYISLIHVAGKRMIAQGTDGLSRGDLDAGVLIGDRMLNHIPLNFSAIERSTNLEAWVEKYMPSPFGKYKVATPEDWFYGCHKAETSWIVAPPPPLALLCLEQIAMAKHKQPSQICFVILIPRLMYNSFQRRLQKESNLTHHMPMDDKIWGANTHFEPLTVSFVTPQRSSQKYPQVWTPSPEELELSEMQKSSWLHSSNRLRKLWTQAWAFSRM